MNKTLKEFFLVVGGILTILVKIVIILIMATIQASFLLIIFLAAWLIACYNKAKTNFQNYFNI